MGRVLDGGVKRALSAAVAVAALSLMQCSLAAAKTKASSATQPAAISSLSYGPLEEEQLTVFPAHSAGAPSVLLVHGGGWSKQANETEVPWVAEDLQSAGFAVFDANYPQDSNTQPAFPLEPEAITAAAEWVRANATSYHGSATNIVLVGGSAGGQLAEMTATRFPVAAVVSLSGPTNLVTLMEMANKKELKDGLGGDVRTAPGCSAKAKSCPESIESEWSPIDNIPTTCPPYLLFSSEKDEVPESQQVEFQAALEGAGCPVKLQALAGNQHSFQYWPKVRATVDAFIAAH
ncbi:MAG TPA: alpha/beta hydrolase [Solirubrobacteraceae bacterium]|nr:alpha/beta hydrolase [Solirubrobacteraceae bacterium]